MIAIVPDWDRIARLHTIRGHRLPRSFWALRVLVVYGWRNAALGLTWATLVSECILHPSVVSISGTAVASVLFCSLVRQALRTIRSEGAFLSEHVCRCGGLPYGSALMEEIAPK